MDKIKRIQELVEICNYHSKKYYTEDKPEISDKEYDKFYTELCDLEVSTGYILTSSPTQKVQGEVLPELVKVQHSEPMLSAEKSKDINDVKKFMGNQECVLSWKLDGLTLVLKYNNGKFLQAITRGSGYEGEDVTHTVKTFTNVPMTIDYKGYLEIRGEGLVPLIELNKVNSKLIAKGEEPYSNCRNLASGSVRQLNSEITKSRNLIFIAFGIINCDKEFAFKNEQMDFLKSLGFQIVDRLDVKKISLETGIKCFQERISELEYLTDGLIIEYNDITYGKAQGSTGHHSKALYALKWSDDSYETVFVGVELNTTRTGMCSITGLFKEVDIDGVKVSRASLHNLDIFETLQLGINDVVTVYRANQVIPQIEDNLTRSETYKIDMHCPSCGSNLVIRQPKEARFLFCENENCPSKLVNKFIHYCSKNAMNIEGFSDAGIELFINKGWLSDFDDIYKLDQYEPEIINLEGWGIRSYNNLMKSVEKSKTVKLENFIYSLGIDQIGKGGAKRLAKHFEYDIQNLFDAIEDRYDFTQVEDFGEVTANGLVEYFSDESNRRIVYSLLDIINFQTEEKKSTGLKDLTGLTFVVTGGVTTFKNRGELEVLISSLNGKLSGSVSTKTNFLINNDIASTSGKNQKARSLGVPVIDENDFNEMIGRNA